MVFSSRGGEDITRILRPALAGEGDAQKKLLGCFTLYIRSCTSKFFLSVEDREDLNQEGRIALFKAIRRYRSRRGPFMPFARLVIRRHINRAAEKMIHRNALERVHTDPDDIEINLGLVEVDNPETEVLAEESRREIESRLERELTPLESEVIHLFLQGMSYKDMARRLNRPAKSVDNALRRIRSKIKV